MTETTLPHPFRRVLIKPSGEVLGGGGFGIDPDTCSGFARELVELSAGGSQIALVIGGGNIFRGIQADRHRMNRISADHIGMLATVINAIALKEFIQSEGARSEIMSALPVPGVIPLFDAFAADKMLQEGVILIFAGGTGHPYFSTDTAAALRAIQIKAEILMKGTKVDGVFDCDPILHRDARHIDNISYDEYLKSNLKVMDGAAIALCRDQKLPVMVFNMLGGNLVKAIHRGKVGTLIC